MIAIQWTRFSQGDVRHSQADIGKVQKLLRCCPTHDVIQGLAETHCGDVSFSKHGNSNCLTIRIFSRCSRFAGALGP
jgi:hypothetical protein